MIKVLLVDDQPAVRQGLRMRLGLEHDLAIIDEAGDGLTAVVLVAARPPDVVVLDLEMPGIDGIATMRVLRCIAPEVVVIILSVHGDVAAKTRALAAGAARFVEKNAGDELLLEAIRGAQGHGPSSAQE